MTAQNVIEKVANHHQIPISALTTHSYKNTYNWHRIAAAKKQISFILSFKYSKGQIAIMLGYKDSRSIRRNIQRVRDNIRNSHDMGFVEGLLSMMG